MKRKKWSELEEQTLLGKYSEFLNNGILAKLKTREKKFKPIADYVNSIHHLKDPISFPFKWSWRDVSIKVQNMRHQYLGVKQKIRVSDNEFNWEDGENHWENFLKYKEVFGDVELEVKENNGNNSNGNGNNCRKLVDDSIDYFGDEAVLGFGFGIGSEELDEEDEGEEEEEAEFVNDGILGMQVSEGELGGERGAREEIEESGCVSGRKLKKDYGRKRFKLLNAQVLELRDAMLRREEKAREREWSREEGLTEREHGRNERQLRRDRAHFEMDEEVDRRSMDLEEKQIIWARNEVERRLRLEREFGEERRRRMKLEEKWEEEEMEWRERMVSLQIEHEKQMMQMHADACQNQLQVLGIMARLMCQYFGTATDGLGGGLGTLPPQVLQNLQHPGGLGENGKPDTNSPSEFL